MVNVRCKIRCMLMQLVRASISNLVRQLSQQSVGLKSQASGERSPPGPPIGKFQIPRSGKIWRGIANSRGHAYFSYLVRRDEQQRMPDICVQRLAGQYVFISQGRKSATPGDCKSLVNDIAGSAPALGTRQFQQAERHTCWPSVISPLYGEIPCEAWSNASKK